MKKLLPYMLALSSLTACTKEAENIMKRSYFKQAAIEIADYSQPSATEEIKTMFDQGRLVYVSGNDEHDNAAAEIENWALVNEDNAADTLMTFHHSRISTTSKEESTYSNTEILNIVSENAQSFKEAHRSFQRTLGPKRNDLQISYNMR